jgi:cyclopropane fatty-acyl-phospholipid synthase-like methyltransferase
VWAYTGVDASQAALTKARSELSGARFQVRLVEADLLAYVDDRAVNERQSCDVILASYAVHHLATPAKQEFFRRAYAKLSSGGCLLFADVFRRDEETREEYLAGYVGMMRNAWAGLAPEHLDSTTEHVLQRDFPETRGVVREMAHEAGFEGEPRDLFQDATGFHRLVVFTKAARV